MESNIEAHKKVIERWLGSSCSVIVCFSGSNNWRKLVYPPYKAFRVVQRRPIAFKFVKEWFIKNADCRMSDGLEADDLLGIIATSHDSATIIVSIDKDLQSVPGFLYNPDKQREPRLVSKSEADWFHVYQTLMGDKTDGYPGCPGIGPVKAYRALGKPGQYTYQELWGRAWSLYRRAGASLGQSESDSLEAMVKQGMVARILRKGEWDAENQKCAWVAPAVVPDGVSGTTAELRSSAF